MCCFRFGCGCGCRCHRCGCGCGCGNNNWGNDNWGNNNWGCGCGCGGRDICAGVRRQAYREGFRNGYWEGFNDARWGRPCGFPQPRGVDQGPGPAVTGAGGCGCNN